MILLTAALILFVPATSAIEDTGILHGNCSESYAFCHRLADCEEIPNTDTFRCVCTEGSFGDGLKAEGASGCQESTYSCKGDTACHPNGFCNKTDVDKPVCDCNEGFTGDGKHTCDDIDECLKKPCDPNANCQNTQPGFKCACKPLFEGDGFTCARSCSVKQDCFQPNGNCIDNRCVCDKGFTGDAVNSCEDINECETGDYVCAEPSECVNNDGAYSCQCPNGYVEKLATCKKLPINCQDIYENDPTAVSGRIFDIDPDSTGPLAAMKVKCEFRNNMGISIVIPDNTEPTTVSDTDRPITYGDSSPESIKGLVDNSQFCYQSQWIECRSGYNLHEDGVFQWTDSKGNVYKSWGGSGSNGQCACGVLGFCEKGTACNCDGSSGDTVVDYGKVFNSERLPVTSIKFKAQSGTKKAKYVISEIKCAPKPFDLLKDCEAIKKDGVDEDGPQVIDFDGPDGPLPPTLVHCDLNTFTHVGLTVLPHDKGQPIIPTENGDNPLSYVTPGKTISGIIAGSAFCSQEIKYTCRHSPININGQQAVFVSVGNDSRQINYFPGAQGEDGSCGCGIAGSCVQKDLKCNCDMNDNTTRYDLGVETNPENLPIVSISIESDHNETYTAVEIGPLKCAHQQFGIEPNCEKYRATGRVDPYAYLIDPDGPPNPKKPNDENVDPFVAECQFTDYPPQGVTIIHHDSEDTFSISQIAYIFQIAYNRVVKDEQLIRLRNRASYCVQALTFDCNNYHLHLAEGEKGVVWKDLEGNEYAYLAGGAENDDGCQCNLEGAGGCAEAKTCNCDAAGNRILQDVGQLSNVTHLPVSTVDFGNVNSQLAGGNSKLNVTLGPLKCYETFPSCYDMWAFMRTRALVGELKVKSGKFTIDPDASGGVEAFTVTCNFPFTVVPVSPSVQYGPTPGQSKCYDISYKDTNGNDISKEQINALVKHSRACQQYLSYNCMNAPKTGFVNYTSCDGVSQPGWAVSGGFETCSCGLTGTCEGGPKQDCNCDTVDGKDRNDAGYIYNTTRLPVCQVCLGLEGIDPENPPPGGSRRSRFSVGYLNCLGYEFGGRESCEDRRLHRSASDVYYTDPDSKYSGTPAFPVYCNLKPYPAMGIMEIYPKEGQIIVPPNIVFDITITYFVFKKEDVDRLIDNSHYCTQEIFIICNDGSLNLEGEYGWYSRDGTAQDSWGGNIGKAKKCEGDGSNCNCNSAGSQTDGGILGDKSTLPISRVKLGASTTERKLTIGPVKCYEIQKDCYDIMISGNTKTPYKNRTYVIDPDGPDGVDPFIVRCHFDKRNDNAVTEVLPESAVPEEISGKTDPDSFSVPFEYKGATPEQINALTRQAPFCHQGIYYECQQSPITDAIQVSVNGQETNSFGTAFDSSVNGCPCSLLGTCDDMKCRCDAKGSMTAFDNGTITDRNVLPVTEIKVGGQSPTGKASVSVSSVRCAERPVDFPRDCEDAFRRGYLTGEVMIYPSANIEPFFVYCDMEINPGHGVAVINNNLKPDTTIPYNGNPIDVTYKGPTEEQIKALVTISQNCYQPVKYDCTNTVFLDAGKFSWTSLDGGVNTYFGAGSSANKDCTCGEENLCGGDGGRSAMQKRNCNCGINDGRSRSDSGVFKSTQDLPIKNLKFSATGVSNSAGNITVGQLFCGQSPIGLNECELGFHDCHENATCLNTRAGFECVCKKGWQGRGRSDVWANGRECYDDNECTFLPCPSTATCDNTPGSFTCTCKDGFRQSGPQSCEDIDECTENKHNCDPNAQCTNTFGSFFCTCKRGYRGEGVNGTCKGIGICACFGDPHCISFDNKWLHFMGQCEYIMAQDGCDGSPQTFSVETRDWDMDRRDVSGISWVKDVTITVNDTKIFLGRNREIRINDRLSLAYNKDGISVDDNGREVVVTTSFGLEVTWDGQDEVEVILTKAYQGKTCGLCGNYNGDRDDDWTVGKHCENEEGTVTDNENLFGNSWVVPEYIGKHEKCTADCNAPPPNSTCDLKNPVINYYCLSVFSPSLSPFRTCIISMTELVYAELYFSCVYDLCHVSNDYRLGICASAQRVANECQRNMYHDVSLWRSFFHCDVTCGENMEYRICGPRGQPEKSRQTTCTNEVSNTQAENAGYCQEGCFCKPGFVLESTRCVKAEDCGCILDGVYMAIGSTYVDSGCNTQQVCNQNGTVTQTPYKCGENTVCKLDLESGIYGCHCADGFQGDGQVCSNDPCFNVTCQKNMECKEGVCQCKMGYQGDCNNCDDIDECATKSDNCNHIGQKCLNYDGGFECMCLDGFVRYGNFCIDIDECQAGFDDCGEHAECVNKHGGYICLCCAGFIQNALGDCIVDSINPTTIGSKCCSCTGPECQRPGKVCGDDGQTYNNERALRITACKEDKQVDVSYRGECKPDCTGVVCERPFETCMVDPVLGLAQCECPKCGGGDPSAPPPAPVCSTRFVVFKSKCQFERIMCEINDKVTTLYEDVSLCDKGPGTSPVGSWTPFGPCSVECGTGKMERSRVEVRKRTTYEKIIFPLTEQAECYGNCTTGPCAGYECAGFSQVCVPSEDNTEAKCICPICEHREDEPLCGLVGNKQMTFKNKCELDRKSCLANKKPFLLSESACGALPLNCSLYAKYTDISEGDCTRDEPVAVGICDGGCGASPDKCCEPTEQEEITYTLTCPDGRTVEKKVQSVRKCKCQDLAN